MRVLAVTAVLAGCTTEHIHNPDIGRIVNDSLPPALHAGAVTPTPRIAPAGDTTATLEMLASQSIRNMFQNRYTDPEYGGANHPALIAGYLNAQVSQIHSRLRAFAELGGHGSCTSNTPVSFTANLASAIDPTMTITLPNLQCLIPFEGSGHDGAVVGSDDNGNTSMWVSVIAQVGGTGFMTSGGYSTYANVQNEGSTNAAAPETVDGMLVEYRPHPQTPYGSALRFKANGTATKFEMFSASNGVGIGGGGGTDNGEVWLGGGFRMISDATLIYGDGVIYNFDNPTALWQPFTVCIDASTLLTVPVTDCDMLATTFTLGTSPSLDYCDIVGEAPGCTIPAPSFTPAPMGASVVSAYAAIFPITAAPDGVSDY